MNIKTKRGEIYEYIKNNIGEIQRDQHNYLRKLLQELGEIYWEEKSINLKEKNRKYAEIINKQFDIIRRLQEKLKH